MRERRRKFTPEFKDEAVKMVTESSRPIAEDAREIQVNEGTLGSWVNRYRVEHVDEEPALSISERARLRELEREVREHNNIADWVGEAGRRRPGGGAGRPTGRDGSWLARRESTPTQVPPECMML